MLLFAGITLPLEDPILKFLLILVIILAAPLLLNKLKIPYLLGLIIAGAVIGPHGLNLVLRDSSIILSGTAGLLYIMFLSGLDMDMSDFRKNGTRSLVFGLYTFCVPLLLGILAGYYILGFSIYSSILLAGLFASQTLIAYPIVSKLGIARDKAVTIAVGGTVITDTLALLLLTVIVGMATGNVDDMFWWRLGASVLLCIVLMVSAFGGACLMAAFDFALHREEFWIEYDARQEQDLDDDESDRLRLDLDEGTGPDLDEENEDSSAASHTEV